MSLCYCAWKDNPFNNKEIKCFFLIISIRASADGAVIDQDALSLRRALFLPRRVFLLSQERHFLIPLGDKLSTAWQG